MSEELIKSYSARISELEKNKLDLQVALRESRGQAKGYRAALEKIGGEAGVEAAAKAIEDAKVLKAQAEGLAKERDDLAAKLSAAPTEKDARIAELETGIRVRDHRDKFAEAVGKELAEGVTVEDVWHFGGFDPRTIASLDEAQIGEVVGKVKESKPILFAKPDAPGNGATSQGSPKPPLKVAEAPGRGARDQSPGRITYRKSDIREPGWMTANPALHKAINDGSAVLVD